MQPILLKTSNKDESVNLHVCLKNIIADWNGPV